MAGPQTIFNLDYSKPLMQGYDPTQEEVPPVAAPVAPPLAEAATKAPMFNTDAILGALGPAGIGALLSKRMIQASMEPGVDYRSGPQTRKQDGLPRSHVKPAAPEAPPAPAPAAVAPANGMSTDLLAEIARQKQALMDLMGPRPTPDYSEYDKEAMGNKDRTKAMAQLALFAGITSGAGQQWQGMGQGLAAAGGVYDKGYDRYLSALGDKTKRSNDAAQQAYADNAAMTEQAADLVFKGRDAKYATGGKATEDRMNFIDKYFGELIKANTVEDETGLKVDRAPLDDIMLRWKKSREAGTIVDSFQKAG